MIASTCTDLRQIRSPQASCFRFAHQLVFLAANKRQSRACKKPASDSREREKIAPGWPQRLQRAIIDTSAFNLMARK
jgi:hypothetical protein